MNKYRAKATTVDNIRFASGREANRYRELKLMERAKLISGLEMQPEYPLEVNGRPVLIRSQGYPNGRRAKYIADFRYTDRAGDQVVEDSKGFDTPLSKLKRAFVEAQYGIKVLLV